MDGNQKKSDGRLQYQRERFFARFCALQVLYQQEFLGERDWNVSKWAYYLCMISDVIDEIDEYLPNGMEKRLHELNDVWKTLIAAEKKVEDMEKLQEEEKSLPEEERTVEETMLKEARHESCTASGKLDEMAERLMKLSCFSFAKMLVEGVGLKLEQIDKEILSAAKNWRLGRMGKLDLNLMRIGAFELLNTPEPPAVPTPPATAINEAIELAKVFCQADARRFVNGVLDKLRKNNQIGRKEEEKKQAEEKPQEEVGEN